MIIRKVKVTNRIVESGATNDFVAHINEIIECQNNIAVILDKYTLVVNKNGNYHKIIQNKFKKPDDFDYDKVTCYVERLTWFYPSFENKMCHSDISTYRVLGIIKQIINNDGDTYDTYNGFEVNHCLPRIYKQNNKITNLEVCSENENRRHYIAWQKCQIYSEMIPLQMSAKGQLVNFILSDKTMLVDKGDNFFILRNYDWENEIVEYKCKLNEDGLWRFNG